MANFLLALVLMLFYYGFINEVPSATVNTTTVEWVTPGSAAAEAGFRRATSITSFDNVNNPDWEAVYEHIQLKRRTRWCRDSGARRAQTLQLSLHVPASAKNDDFEISDTGISPQYPAGPIAVAQVQPGTPAEQAGLRAGDAIEAVDGQAFHSVNTLLAYMQMGTGQADGARQCCATAPRSSSWRRRPSSMRGWKLGFAPEAPSHPRRAAAVSGRR